MDIDHDGYKLQLHMFQSSTALKMAHFHLSERFPHQPFIDRTPGPIYTIPSLLKTGVGPDDQRQLSYKFDPTLRPVRRRIRRSLPAGTIGTERTYHQHQHTHHPSIKRVSVMTVEQVVKKRDEDVRENGEFRPDEHPEMMNRTTWFHPDTSYKPAPNMYHPEHTITSPREITFSFPSTPRFGVLPQAGTAEHNRQQLGKDSPGPKYMIPNSDVIKESTHAVRWVPSSTSNSTALQLWRELDLRINGPGSYACHHGTMSDEKNGSPHLSISKAPRFSSNAPFISHKHSLRTHLGHASPGPLYTSHLNTIAYDTMHRQSSPRYTAPAGDHVRQRPHIDRSTWLFSHNEKSYGEHGEVMCESRVIHDLCSPGPAAYATPSDFPQTYEQMFSSHLKTRLTSPRSPRRPPATAPTTSSTPSTSSSIPTSLPSSTYIKPLYAYTTPTLESTLASVEQARLDQIAADAEKQAQALLEKVQWSGIDPYDIEDDGSTRAGTPVKDEEEVKTQDDDKKQHRVTHHVSDLLARAIAQQRSRTKHTNEDEGDGLTVMDAVMQELDAGQHPLYAIVPTQELKGMSINMTQDIMSPRSDMISSRKAILPTTSTATPAPLPRLRNTAKSDFSLFNTSSASSRFRYGADG